ncbi:ArsA family ATPase [Streptomyces sp. NPDC059176]|uniref:ArsA family ATPase n=1 Tax=unclassified Streptomyces TaxID=2593676 RepID=UPI0036BD3891
MRTVLVTGPGGSGRTTVAAATAHAAARRGKRTLLLSGEADALVGASAGTVPTQVGDGLWLARTDSGTHFRTEVLALQERCSAALDLLGAHRFEEAELTELPGSEEFALLHALRGLRGADWDVVVVDMPPVRDAIGLLALPEQLRRYLRRMLPPERQAARALRPVLAQLAGVPMPAQWLYETAARWEKELAAVQDLVTDRNTTVRLVAEPGPAAEDAVRTARLGLALYGRDVETLVANRILPAESPDPWLAALRVQQEKVLHGWYTDRPAQSAVCEVRHLGRDPRGADDLAALEASSFGGVFGTDGIPGGCAADTGLAAGLAPLEPGRDDPWVIQQQDEDRGAEAPGDAAALSPGAERGELHWVLPLPGAVKEELQLLRRGDELFLGVGPFRRILPLPSALRRCTVSGAGLRDGLLRVRFTPDPALWPRGR